MQQPTCPYKSIDDFIEKFTIYSSYFAQNRSKWPCVNCRESGFIWDPNDPRCPIEGNKCRNRLSCPSCNGTREGPKSAIVKEYNAVLAEFRQRLAKWNRSNKLKGSALKKLTKAEIKALQELGF